jgi:protein gp37
MEMKIKFRDREFVVSQVKLPDGSVTLTVSFPDEGSVAEYKVHPLAAIFPFIPPDEMLGLIDSISSDVGQQEEIVLSPDEKTIIDGRNRWIACQIVNADPRFRSVPEWYTEWDICEFIITANLHRRHLVPGQKALIMEEARPILEEAAKERQREHGGTAPGRKSLVPMSEQVMEGRVDHQLARMAGVATSTQSQAKKVLEESSHLAAQVLSGEKSLNEAYKEVRVKPVPAEARAEKKTGDVITLKTHLGQEVTYSKPLAKAKFNKTNDQVSWAGWTWNPVTGCLHGCKYCYARELANKKSYEAAYPVGFTPLFHHERLEAPTNTEIPEEAKQDYRLKRVFVCSMADLYGKWVPDDWIKQVHASCIANPQWDYLMLTKFPRRYVGLELPKTAWLGTTVDEQKRVRLAEEAFRQIKNVRVKWLSLEPLLAPLEFTDLSMFDWIVIGSQSSTEQPDGHVKEFAPPFKWVARIVAQAHECGCRVYLKPNLLGITNPQSPGMQLLQEEPEFPQEVAAAA